jgi:hypothetical protein
MDMVEQVTTYRPLDPEEGKKEKKTLVNDTIERYTRVWLWHMVAQFLFPDASGNTMLWMVLP